MVSPSSATRVSGMSSEILPENEPPGRPPPLSSSALALPSRPAETTYHGYDASGGPVGVGAATAKSMVLNTVMVHLVGMVGTQIFWGSNPRAPIGG